MELEIFNVFPGLKRIPRIELGDFPTPVQRLTSLEKALGTSTEIWIKRDDLSGELYGGNKVRKLEFSFGDARAKGKKSVITTGGVGSNHALAVAIYGKHLGFKVILPLFDQPLTGHVRENLLLDYYFGAELIYGGSISVTAIKGIWKMVKWRFENGEFPYFIPPGASNEIGTVGYVNAMFELKKQIDNGELPRPELIFVTLGSTGTMAGLLLGSRLSGINIKIVGVRVVDRVISNGRAMRNLALKTWNYMKKNDNSLPEPKKRELRNFDVIHRFFGGEYGRYIPEGVELIKILKETEGIILDGTYTSKTFAGLVNFVRENRVKRVLFWHTYNNRRRFDNVIEKIDWRLLPRELHKFFNGKIKIRFDF